MEKISKVSLIELEKKFFDRRPAATFDLSDNFLDVNFKYFIDQNSINQIPINASRIKGFSLDCDVAVIYSYRIPELLLMIMNPDVKFVYIQHGYYPDLIKRHVFQILRKFDRIILFLRLICLALFAGLKLSYLLDILSVWTVPEYKAKNLPEPALCVVLGDEWEKFHKKKLGWVKSQYINKKYYEPKLILSNSQNYDYQYICQSLVEDSRLSSEKLVTEINKFILEKNIKKLALVLHPRSDKKIYENLACDVEYLTDRCFDVPTFGHYSSLLLYLAENNISVEVCGEPNITIPFDFLEKLVKIKSGDYERQYSNDPRECYINQDIKNLL